MKLHEWQEAQRAKQTIRQRVKALKFDRREAILEELAKLEESLVKEKLEVRTKPYKETRMFHIQVLQEKIDGLRLEL